MLQSNPSQQNVRSAYPGEYIPSSQFLEYITSHTHSDTLHQQNIEIFEDNHYFTLELSAPGLKRENLLVKISEKGSLIIKGIQRNTSLTERSFQISSTAFRREIALPQNIDTNFVKAQFKDGVLSLCFLKTTENYPKRPSIVAVY